MPTTPPAEPWLHPAIEVGVSSIEGSGLFAVEAVPVETTIVVFGGRLVSDQELLELFASSTDYIDTLTTDLDSNLVLPGRTPAGFGNHSCDPNLWWGGDFSLISRRHLTVGDEVTVDYGTITDSEDFTMPCSCGSDACRGVVTGQDWRRPDLQPRYGRHWVPALLRRIDESSSARALGLEDLDEQLCTDLHAP